MRRFFRLTLTVVTWALIVSCEDVPTSPEIATLVIGPVDASLFALGANEQFNAFPVDVNGYPVAGVQLLWASSDPTVATVSEVGLATAMGDGTATITATGAGLSASTVLTVSAGILNVAEIWSVDQEDVSSANDTATVGMIVTADPGGVLLGVLSRPASDAQPSLSQEARCSRAPRDCRGR